MGTVASGGGGAVGEVAGATLAELQCPTAANNAVCAATTLYDSWDSFIDANGNDYWNFGSILQLPGILIEDAVYRDADGDGILD